jgi:hypothetical protein
VSRSQNVRREARTSVGRPEWREREGVLRNKGTIDRPKGRSLLVCSLLDHVSCVPSLPIDIPSLLGVNPPPLPLHLEEEEEEEVFGAQHLRSGSSIMSSPEQRQKPSAFLSLSHHRDRDPCACRWEHVFFPQGPMPFALVLSCFWAVSALKGPVICVQWGREVNLRPDFSLWTCACVCAQTHACVRSWMHVCVCTVHVFAHQTVCLQHRGDGVLEVQQLQSQPALQE